MMDDNCRLIEPHQEKTCIPVSDQVTNWAEQLQNMVKEA